MHLEAQRLNSNVESCSNMANSGWIFTECSCRENFSRKAISLIITVDLSTVSV